MYQKIATNGASYGGILSHMSCWVTASSDDYMYPNPNFRQSETEEPIDIYCVHGTADRAQAFSRIAERLLEKKLGSNIRSLNLVAFNGRFQGYGIEYFAQQLAEKIIKNEHQRVILAGHSRGGLVISWFTEYLADESAIQVDLVFNFATPFNGSHLAMAPLKWFSTSVYQMEIGSEFLKKLGEQIMFSKARYYFFEASDDFIVSTGQAYVLAYVEKYPESLIKVDTPHGHLSIMSSHKLVNEMHRVINAFEVNPNLVIIPEKIAVAESKTEAGKCNEQEKMPSIFDF